MQKKTRRLLRFGPFLLDTSNRFLLRGDSHLPLTPKAYDVLALLVENAGQVLEKDELMKAVWPDTFVEEANLTQQISTLRKVLGEQPDHPTYIETIPRRGYRFAFPVTREEPPQDMALPGAPPAAVVFRERTTSTMLIEEELSAPQPAPALDARALPPARRSTLRAWLAAGVVILAAGILLVWSALRRPGEGPGRPQTLAVLPFRPVGAAPAEDVLYLGMADTLATRLASLPQLVLRPISAVRRFSSPEQDPLAAGRELGVECVLDGTVQRAGQRLRVNVRLLRVRDGAALWSGRFDEDFTNIFAVQDSISEQVARSLAPELTLEQQHRLTKRFTRNAEAYEHYLIGRHHWNRRTQEGFRKAIESFNRAIAADPLYALAYAGLADCYNVLNNYDVAPASESAPRAKAAALRALELDESLAEAHASLALVYEAYDYDQAAAEREYRRALLLNPNYPTARHWYGLFLVQMGRSREGIAELKSALALDPLSPIISVGLAWAYYFSRDFASAAAQAQQTLSLGADFWPAHLVLGWTFEQQRKLPEALASLRRAVELSSSSTLALTGLAHAQAEAGELAAARQSLRQIEQRASSAYVSPFFRAALYEALGQRDTAIEWLENSYRERAYWLISIKVNPWFDSMRGDARFRDLESRIGFSEAASSRSAEPSSAGSSGPAHWPRRYTSSPRAAKLYLEGRFHWEKRTREGLEMAIACFQKSVELDRGFAPGYAGLADSWLLMANLEYRPPAEVFPKAKAAALKALELDRQLPDAHATLAFLKHSFDWDWNGAEQEFLRALELDPDSPTARHWYAIHLAKLRRTSQSLEEIERAHSLAPLSLPILTSRAWLLYFARRFDEAAQHARKALELDPGYPRASLMLGLIAIEQRRYDQAAAAFAKHHFQGGLAITLAASGRAAQARGMLADLERRQHADVPALEYSIYVRAALGEKDAAFRLLESAYSRREVFLTQCAVHPLLDPLRSDARFQDLLRRMKLPLAP
jgi:DNA-binding winged helix-turn-helix (wHTH) protein/TolB-like protein/Tfp pilus assembly protein PilF